MIPSLITEPRRFDFSDEHSQAAKRPKLSEREPDFQNLMNVFKNFETEFVQNTIPVLQNDLVAPSAKRSFLSNRLTDESFSTKNRIKVALIILKEYQSIVNRNQKAHARTFIVARDMYPLLPCNNYIDEKDESFVLTKIDDYTQGQSSRCKIDMDFYTKKNQIASIKGNKIAIATILEEVIGIVRVPELNTPIKNLLAHNSNGPKTINFVKLILENKLKELNS